MSVKKMYQLNPWRKGTGRRFNSDNMALPLLGSFRDFLADWSQHNPGFAKVTAAEVGWTFGAWRELRRGSCKRLDLKSLETIVEGAACLKRDQLK